MDFIIEDNSLDNDNLLKNESIFHTANGYIGVRGNFEEGYRDGYTSIRGTYINAFYETNKIQYGEKLYGFPDSKQSILNVIDAQTIELFIGDEAFSLFECEILDYRRAFDLKEGCTIRNIHFRTLGGHEFKINIKRLASFIVPELFLIDYDIQSINYKGRVQLISRLNGDVSNYSCSDDPRISSENVKALQTTRMHYFDNISTISSVTKNSRLEVSCSTLNRLDCTSRVEYAKTDKEIDTFIEFEIHPEQSVKLNKFCIYTDSRRHPDPERYGIELCSSVCTKTAQYYFEEQINFLKDFWNNSDVVIEGNELIQQGINYNIYQLLQSVGRDKYSNICAKGLSGEGYEGHYFWDTEIYMLPFFLLTKPEIAKNLLMYRYETLNEARKRAKELGHSQGALYPWRTITGGECSAFFPSGTAQYHINADIAYSFIKYYQITGDLDFIKVYGAEVLFETARLWLDTGHFDGELFKIDAVTGPDEYTCIVNNNYYTNVMAKHNLKWAVKFYNLLFESHRGSLNDIIDGIGLKASEVESWSRASMNMYLPYNSELDINPQDDSFLNKAVWDFKNTPNDKYPLLLNYHPLILYRYQVCKQADTVLAHFLLEDEQKLSTIKNSYDYYEKITTHDSSLSSCIFSIMASKIGYRQKAYDYFMESSRLDLDDTHGNTKDGIHTANMGGTYLAIVYGFAGLRIGDDRISFNPSIPREWAGYGFKINYRNRLIFVKITKEYIEFTLEKGEPLDIIIRPSTDIVKLGYETTSATIKCKYN